MATHSLAPEALGQRPDLPHNLYRVGSQPLGLEGVNVEFGSKTKPHTYNAPVGEGDVSRRLRRFALTLSRYKLPTASKYIKSWRVSQPAFEAAEMAIAHAAYQKAFGDDPTVGTMSVNTLVKLLQEPNPSRQLFAKALSYAGTMAGLAIEQSLGATPLGEEYKEDCDRIIGYYLNDRLLNQVTLLNHKHPRYRKRAREVYKALAGYIDSLAQENEGKFSTAEAKHKKAREAEKQHGKGKATIAESNGWEALYVVKPDLVRSHTGKLGRRNVYTGTGRSVKNVSRLYSDPEQRIFTRKTRALGAVVVFDCSGSMGLDDDDLQHMMDASAGATVLCYSTGYSASEDNPNAWIVARKGRQVRSLPDFPGGNGCDGPALRYGLQLRSSTRQPVIWVSDEGVTGKNDANSAELLRECKGLVRKYGIKQARNVSQAIKIMKQLQGRG
tara:strand:- start:1398 stop:2720 length:1323 start_codon:yes stop_codon:yes gene_type:complete